jgi:hypothetical protein
MARDNIIDKGSTKVSPWFGFKYRVTPESSKLLQEAVFAAGGGWNFNGRNKLQHLGEEYLYINEDGEIYYGASYCDFQSDHREEKEPPQPTPKEFKVGYWYLLMEGVRFFTKGRYYQYTRQGNDGTYLGVVDDTGNLVYARSSLFNINSESPCDPTATKALQDDKVRVQSHLYYDSSGKWVVPKEYAGVDLNTLDLTKFVINQQEEVNMSNNTQRKTVTVNLIDRDSALDEKFALVATFGEFTTSKSPEALIRSIIIDPKNKVAELIAQHNEVRVKQTNKEIMERTGNKVTLEAVEESDLHWEIR